MREVIFRDFSVDDDPRPTNFKGGVQYDRGEKWTYFLDIVDNDKGLRNPLDDSYKGEKVAYFPADKSYWHIAHHKQHNHYSVIPRKGKCPDELSGLYTDYMIAARAIANYLTAKDFAEKQSEVL